MLARKGVCHVCGCKVIVARYESLARVLRRLDEMRCPQCGSALAISLTDPPELFSKKGQVGAD